MKSESPLSHLWITYEVFSMVDGVGMLGGESGRKRSAIMVGVGFVFLISAKILDLSALTTSILFLLNPISSKGYQQEMLLKNSY